MKGFLLISKNFIDLKFKDWELFQQILTFLFVGGTSFLLYEMVANVINESKIDIPNLGLFSTNIDIGKSEFSVAVAYLVSGIYNFILNLKITFKGLGSWQKYLFRFVIVLIINNFAATLLLTPLLTDILHITFQLTIAINSLVLTFFNFIFHKKFTYR